MTSTLTSMRRLSVRFGATTVDLAVQVGTRVADLLESGGFPEGVHLVDASGAALADGDQICDVVEDGALVYVVDAVHTPSLTRLTPSTPARAIGTPRAGDAPPASAPAGQSSAAPSLPALSPASPAPAAGQSPAHVLVDPAAAGARTRSAARRSARGRTAAAPPTPTAPVAPTPTPEAAPGTSADDVGPTGRRRAVVPPTARRAPALPPGAPGDGSGRALPPPPGPTRSTPVPLPPGGAGGRGAHAARDIVAVAPTSAPVAPDTTPARRTGSLAVPSPPRVATPPSGATGRAALAGRGSHRVATEADDRPRERRAGPADVALSPGAYAVPMVLAPAAVLLVVLASTGTALPTWSTWSSGAALVLAGVVAAIRAGSGPVTRWGRLAGALAGGCGAFVLGVSLEAALDVSAVAGLIVAAAVAMLGRTSAIRQGVFEPWITVAAVGFGALAVDAALAIALSWPLYVGPLLLAGVSPLVMRALPALSLDVDEEQLVDTERLSNTSWSARTGVKRRRRPLRQATVELITMRASGIVAAGFVTVAAFSTCGYGIAVVSTMPDALARWSLFAEGVLLVGGLGLASRTVRDRFGKRVLRFAAVALTVETGFTLSRRVGDAGDVVLVALLVGLALGVIGVSLALDAGWRSLRLSRIADSVEGFCVVFALPAALLAVDVIAVLRQAAS